MTKENYAPEILQYIPFFYIIWSDDLLSASEINVVEKAIQDDDSLDTASKKQLRSWLDVKHPPKDSLFKSWKQLISNTDVKLVEHEPYPLSALSQKVASHYKKGFPFNEQLKTIEINLGIQPNHYNHLFDVEITVDKNANRYTAKKIDAILKGEHGAMIDRFRKDLRDPIFSWDIYREKEAYRKHVLKQVEVLADKGYGAMAYPKAYGGKERHGGLRKYF